MYNVVSFAGIFILMTVAWLFSANRKVINWRVIIWGTVIQLLFALFIFVVPAGAKVFLFINDALVRVIDVAGAGSKFIFGRLAIPPGATDEWGQESLGFIFAFQVLPQIIFFAALMAVLYYMGVMTWLVRIFAKIFTKLLRVSGAESLCASSNIFVGIESATTIRPYLEKMTLSELCTILTAGMATIASTVLAIYILILQEQFPTIAGHLVSASFLSAPAAIIMSKLLYPETGKPETLGIEVMPYYEKESSLIEAIINGATAGLKLAVGVVALLVAFLGLAALVDFIFTGAGMKLNVLIGTNIDWSLKGLLGYIFYPLTLIIGVPPSDAFEISKIIGERTIVTETKSYMDLAVLMDAGGLKHPRSAFLATYALCGFAHVASLAIFVGGTAALVPKRTADLSAVGPRALLAATLACLMTAAVAGTFYGEGPSYWGSSMSEPTKYNVIIAGAGPAGSTVGYLLSKSGLRVLIIDKSTFPRKKLCAGLITYKTIKLLERVFGETVPSLKEKDIIKYESSCYEIFCKEKLITKKDITIPFRFIDRESYDHFLLKKARHEGADLIEGDGVKSLDVLKSMITTRSGRRFSADVIIGADGVNSRIRRSFLVDLFGRDDWVANLAAGHEIFVGRDSIKKQSDHPILFFDYIDSGYAWIFPDRERLKIGMCALNRNNRKDILTAFQYFLSEIGLQDTQEEKISSYVLPYGNFLPEPVFRNIMLVGDAAGFADPLLGEGIFYAQRSAELVSQAILEVINGSRGIDKSHDALARAYIKLLQQHIFTELEYAGRIREVMFARLNLFRYLPLKILMGLLGDKPVETVHGIRSYKWMKKQAEY